MRASCHAELDPADFHRPLLMCTDATIAEKVSSSMEVRDTEALAGKGWDHIWNWNCHLTMPCNKVSHACHIRDKLSVWQ